MGRLKNTDKTYHFISVTFPLSIGLKMEIRTLISFLIFMILRVKGEQCNGGFKLMGNLCYSYIGMSSSWMVAQATCRALGGYLAEPKTDAENTDVKGLALTNNANSVWIGGEDLSQEGAWYWAHSGDKIGPFTDWLPGEPNDNHGSEDCLDLYRGQWNDEVCSKALPFICEKEPEG